MSRSREVVAGLLADVAARDAEAVAGWFTDDATWANVPHPPVVGRAGVRDLLAPILARSERVVWEVVSASYTETCAWVERVDRFWIDGEEYAAACHGVFVLDPSALLLREVRDYVDLTPWRARLQPVLGAPGRDR